MEQQGKMPVSFDRERKFDMIVNELKSILGTSRSQSDKFYEKACRFNGFSLSCDEEKRPEDKNPQIMPSGLLTEIRALIGQLEVVNKRNQEIIEHLDDLI